MLGLHLTRNLRSLAYLVAMAAVCTGLGMLWWANHTGLPDSWRAAIEKTISKQGAHVTIGSLSYVPFRGVIATDVRVYSEPELRREISRLERVILDIDKTKLARGQINLTMIQLRGARLDLPIDPKNPAAGTLHVDNVHGKIFLPGDRRIEVKGARGRIAGIDVSLDGRIIGYQQNTSIPPDESHTRKRREILARIVSELGKWHFSEDQPPALRIDVDGDVNDRSSFNAKIALRIKELERNGHTLDEIRVDGTLIGDLLTVTTLHATDPHGALDGHIDYNLEAREGRFDIDSTVEIPELLSAWLGLSIPRDLLLGGNQSLEAAGDFRLDEQNVPQIRVTGHARCESVMLKGVPFDSVASSFSWRDNELYLRDILLRRQDGEATAKAMVQWPLVRLALHTTLPVPVYRPFFVGQPLGLVLHDFSEREGAHVDVTLEGSFNGNDRTAWAYTGSGSVRNLNYKGVPVNAANCKLSLNHHELDFYDGTVVFNYAKYPLREAYGGPVEGTAKVGRIRYDAPTKTVGVENVSGSIWAAPMVRLFAPKIADPLEQYRFHQPPELKASGVVDVTPQGRTRLGITFRSDHAADYRFLGEILTLQHPSGRVDIQGSRVTVGNLKLGCFEAPVDARFETTGSRLTGEISWTKLPLSGLATTYHFPLKGGGHTTGRLEFAMTDNKVATMTGEGLLAIENAELFSVPMFGPLTPLIGNVLNNDNAATQHARNAFCTFTIRNGVLASNDFQTSTRSLNFTGDGSIDMRSLSLDMTMRMNARGLLGIITLPLRPFSGLFQFHGSGPLKDTHWESMKFTSPPEDQREMLLSPPRATVVPDR